VEARVDNPREKKLDLRTISGYFIGYPEKSKGFRFYCPNHSTRIVETAVMPNSLKMVKSVRVLIYEM
jgi:hypothetical protein